MITTIQRITMEKKDEEVFHVAFRATLEIESYVCVSVSVCVCVCVCVCVFSDQWKYLLHQSDVSQERLSLILYQWN